MMLSVFSDGFNSSGVNNLTIGQLKMFLLRVTMPFKRFMTDIIIFVCNNISTLCISLCKLNRLYMEENGLFL